jgi:hypothetical protein
MRPTKIERSGRAGRHNSDCIGRSVEGIVGEGALRAGMPRLADRLRMLRTVVAAAVIVSGIAPAVPVIATTVPPATCALAPFDDVPPASPFCSDIEWMKTSGIATGFGDGTYRPGLAVTRQAMAAFMARLAGAILPECDEASDPPFSDVAITHTFCREIQWMKVRGISTGFGDGSYRPSAGVTRQSMAAFLSRLSGVTLAACDEAPFPDVPTEHPFCREIKWMKDSAVSTGFADGTYRPASAVTRQAMSAFMRRLYGILHDGPTELTGQPSDPATDAIPDLDFEFNPDDYAPHPDLEVTISYRTLYLAFKLDTTVADANAVLAEIEAEVIGGISGKADEAEGLLYVRVPTASHAEMDALIEQLRADPRVLLAVQDSVLTPTEIPSSNGGGASWIWDAIPDGDNWGIEQIRMPQVWNLNRAVIKNGRRANIGVLDVGFATHDDVAYDEILSPLDSGPVDHGTHVAGVIGASYNNGKGVDGVDPFVHLTVKQVDNSVGWGIMSFLESTMDLDIVNLSLAYNWYKGRSAADPAVVPAAQALVKNEAAVFALWQFLRRVKHQSLPLFVAAAGNDSNKGPTFGDVDAKWSSPWNYAALVGGASNVIVVEAIGLSPGGGTARAPFSDMNGHVSAPGVNICSTTSYTPPPNPQSPPRPCGGTPLTLPLNEPYLLMNGTSMAAPHVTGVAGYLVTLDPTLTPEELRGLIIANARATGGGASPQLDAFASALAIDGLRGNSSVVKRLVDFDDGTDDGNLRQSCSTSCTEVTGEDFDLDGGQGDGSVDMSDFRRWRDSLLFATNAAGLALDGSLLNPKRDLNHNGRALADENPYPDGDFNGDGKLDRAALSFVPGFINAQATDLQVMQALFDDPDHSAGQLDALIDSADFHVDPGGCAGDGIVTLRTKIIEAESGIWVDGRIDTSNPTSHEYTLPVRAGGYIVRVEAMNVFGNVAGVAQNSFLAPLGSDSWFAPTSCGRITLSPSPINLSLNAGDTTTRTVHLVSADLEASWEFTNVVANVDPSLTGGTLQSGDDVAIDLTITCPASPGGYGGTLDLDFTDAEGNLIQTGVPEGLPVSLECLEGGVDATPETIPISILVGESETAVFALMNRGASLEFEAVSDSPRVTVDDNSSADLPARGRVDVTVTATCPSTPGYYNSDVLLTWARDDGKPVTVEVPDDVAIALHCRPLIEIERQAHTAGVALTLSPPGVGTSKYLQEDVVTENDLGTAFIRHIQGGYVNYESVGHSETSEPLTMFDFGAADAVADLSGTYHFQEPYNSDRTVTGHTTTHFESTFDGSDAFFSAVFTHSLSQTLDVQDTMQESTAGVSHAVFELARVAEVLASWSCGGQFTGDSYWQNAGVRLVNITDSEAVPVFLAVGDGRSECGFEGTIPPGRYYFTATSSLVRGRESPQSTMSENDSATFAMLLTLTAPE